MPPAEISVRPLTDDDREDIATWRYGGALAIYDPDAHELHEPDHVALVTNDGELVGYGTLGVPAQVPGGDYRGAAVDVGLGLRPSLVGCGHGASALRALMAEAARRRGAAHVRATVAEDNHRATALVRGLGFVATHRFVRARDGRVFVQFERTRPR